ncbi:MAG: DOMON domain-containing protein [Chloroflexota bacterium]|nr:hypothetical protein [Chloroflexota bacterium]
MNKRALMKHLYVASLALLLLALSIFGISCRESALEPAPAQSPATHQEPSEEWKPDGVIGSGEYLSEASHANGAHELFWNSDQQYIYIGMRAKTSGWVAMAVQPGSKMKDADMVFGYVEDGEVTVLDLYSTGNFGPHPPDTELGGTDDIIEYGGAEADGYTTIEFKRALATGDQYDQELSSGKNQIIWSFGSRDDFSLKHSNRGYGEIDLPPR